MSWNDKIKLSEERQKILVDMTNIAERAGKESRSLNGEEKNLFDQFKARIAQIDEQNKILDDIAEMRKAQASVKENTPEKLHEEYMDTRSSEKEIKQQRRAFQAYIFEGNSRDLATSSFGGVVAPAYWAQDYIKALKASTSLLGLGAIAITTPDMGPQYLPVWNDTGNTSQTGAEGYSASAATDPTVSDLSSNADAVLKAYRYSPGKYKYSAELDKTNFVSFEQTLMQSAMAQIRRTLNNHTITGTGTNQAKGIVTSGTSAFTSSHYASFTFAEVNTLLNSLDLAYRLSPSCRIFGSAAAKAQLRSLTDGSGRTYWAINENIAIEGIPFVEAPEMSGLTAGGKPLAICDVSQYYIRFVDQVSVIVDPYSDSGSGKIGITVASWHDGRLPNTAACKYMTLSNSVT